MPALPKCFNNYRGIGLRPDDLLALKYTYITFSSSLAVIADVADSSSA